MPELPEVEAVRLELDPFMRGVRFTRVIVRRPDLRAPFPKRFAARLTGQTVQALTRRAKYLLGELSSGDTLLVHLGMTGSFRVDPGGAFRERDAHDHVVFEMSNGAVITFNDPRRFGVMDLLSAAGRARHRTLGTLGPEPLSDELNAAALARAFKGKKTSLKIALLDQRVVAGLGNIYVSEALHLAGLSPLRKASTLATATGRPRPAAVRLTAAIKQVIAQAIERTHRPAYRARRFRVYDRESEPCPTRSCTGTIRRRTQAGRSTFYCPVCQR